MRDIDHLFGHDPGAGEFELGDELARIAGAQRPSRGAERRQMIGGDTAVVLGTDRAALDRGIGARRDPGFAHRREALGEIDPRGGFGIGAGRVIDPNRRLLRIAECDLAERDANLGPALRRGVDLAGTDDRASGDGLRRGEFRNLIHGRLLSEWESGGRTNGENRGWRPLRPFAGMTRIRFKGFGVSPSQPRYGTPLEQTWNLSLESRSVNRAKNGPGSRRPHFRHSGRPLIGVEKEPPERFGRGRL